MGGSSENRPVLVAVANPDHVEQLVRTASDLARVGDGHIRIVSVVAKSRESPVSVYSDKAIIDQYAHETRALLDTAAAVAPDAVSVDREIVVDRSIAGGVLTAISRVDARALVLGWHGRRARSGVVLGTNVDRLIERAPCDLYVERVGYEANGVDSILLPVAGGPHVRPAGVAAKAIAAHNDATVRVLSIVASNEDEEDARDDIETAIQRIDDAPGTDVAVERQVRTGDDVSDALAEAASDHDLLVFGVTRRSSIRRRLVGSIPQTVIPRIDETVLLARSGDVIDVSRFGHRIPFRRHS